MGPGRVLFFGAGPSLLNVSNHDRMFLSRNTKVAGGKSYGEKRLGCAKIFSLRRGGGGTLRDAGKFCATITQLTIRNAQV
jgi:hypothetical protein